MNNIGITIDLVLQFFYFVQFSSWIFRRFNLVFLFFESRSI